MTFDLAVRTTELLLAWAFALQSIEHLCETEEPRVIHAVRLGLCIVLGAGFAPGWVLIGLCFWSLWSLHRFQGPYCGGADRMGFLVLYAVTAVHWAPNPALAELAFGYLAVQLVLSYVMSGWVKIVNPDWRSGRALCDVFAFSAYPVSEVTRGWATYPRLMSAVSRMVIAFELMFPLGLLHPVALTIALSITGSFHLGNAIFLGLNRFFWIWIAAYPSIIWFQGRGFG